MNDGKQISKVNVVGALSIAALMFSSYVGPGFAAGTQTVAYYLKAGSAGVIWGPLLVGILTFVWCWLTFEFNRIYKPKDYREQSDMIYKNPAVRQVLGIFKDIFSMVQIFLVAAGMISGAAIILEQTFGIPNMAGTFLFGVFMIGFTLKGANLVMKLGNTLTILIIAIIIFIFFISIGICWPAADQFIESGSTAADYGLTTGYAWVIVFSSIILFTCGANAAVPSCLVTIRSKKDTFLAALGTAVLCGGGTMLCTILFAAGMPHITKESIPMLYLLHDIVHSADWTRYLYVAIAVSAMLSTGVGLLFGISERYQLLAARHNIMANKTAFYRRAVIGVIVTLISVAFSRLGILTIVAKGYVAFTLISAPFLIYILFLAVPWRIYKDKQDGTYPEQK